MCTKISLHHIELAFCPYVVWENDLVLQLDVRVVDPVPVVFFLETILPQKNELINCGIGIGMCNHPFQYYNVYVCVCVCVSVCLSVCLCVRVRVFL